MTAADILSSSLSPSALSLRCSSQPIVRGGSATQSGDNGEISEEKEGRKKWNADRKPIPIPAGTTN